MRLLLASATMHNIYYESVTGKTMGVLHESVKTENNCGAHRSRRARFQKNSALKIIETYQDVVKHYKGDFSGVIMSVEIAHSGFLITSTLQAIRGIRSNAIKEGGDEVHPAKKRKVETSIPEKDEYDDDKIHDINKKRKTGHHMVTRASKASQESQNEPDEPNEPDMTTSPSYEPTSLSPKVHNINIMYAPSIREDGGFFVHDWPDEVSIHDIQQVATRHSFAPLYHELAQRLVSPSGCRCTARSCESVSRRCGSVLDGCRCTS